MTAPISKGFTLIELLVVIAIISLLVSILLPSLNKAKELAKSVICLTNVRIIGTAAILYTSDNEGYFFPHYDYRDKNVDGLADGPTWFYDGPGNWYCIPFFGRQYLGPDVISSPSLGEGSIYDCPLWDGTPWGYHNNYGYNMDVGPNFGYLPALNIESVTRPTDLVMFADGVSYAISPDSGYWAYWDGIDGVRYHADDRFNAVLMDGHAGTHGQGDLEDANWTP